MTVPLHHESSVNSAVFSPDGSKIVTASSDNTARVWDAATGRPLTEPLQHGDSVNSAVFSPDGTKIVTASADGTARMWSIAPPSNIPSPNWLAPLAETVAGYRINDQSVLEPVDTAQLLQFRERFRNSKDKDPYSQIARWFFADKATRPASPYNMGEDRRSIFDMQWDMTEHIAHGDTFKAQNNSEGAYESYAKALAIMRELTAMGPQNAQRDLSIGFLKIGNVLLASGDYPTAAAFCQNAVGTLKANGEKIPDQKILLSQAQGCLCWSAVLTGNFSKAIEAGEEAVALLDHDKSCPARVNLAHAYLLSNQFERARAIYQKYAGSTFEDGRKWNDEVRSDFQLLRKAGRDHPDMKKIEMLQQ